MIDELNKRIIEIMVRTEHSKSSFATALGVSLPLITHITTGRNKPGIDLIQKVLSHFEHISPDWLLLGTGDMYRQQVKQKDFTAIFAQIDGLMQEIKAVQNSQLAVVQYHKILFDEIKHLEEMDQLIHKDHQRLTQIQRMMEEVKREIES